MTPQQIVDAIRRLDDEARAHVEEARCGRAQRDRLILDLHATGQWGYGRIAVATGLSKGLVALICRHAL